MNLLNEASGKPINIFTKGLQKVKTKASQKV